MFGELGSYPVSFAGSTSAVICCYARLVVVQCQGFGIEIPEGNHSIHIPMLRHPFNSCAITHSRSHSNSIPHHSNSIPVIPEVYRIPYIKLPNSSQFY